jgi:Zn-dependent M28 family amino/carboxypeptidase
VIVGGHYDTWNLRDPDPDASAPGANDNGSGTVAVLEAARVLSRRTWRRSIALVCFDAEEHGLVGSSAFAPFLEEMGLEIIAMINCDIVGGQNQRGRVRVFSEGTASRHVARFAELVAERHTGLELLLQPLLDRPGRGGDHIPFARRGHPAIRWIDETETLEHQHTPTDTVERIDFERLAEIARGVAAVAGSLADALPAPRVRRESAGGIVWEAVDGAAGYVAGTIGPDGLSFTRVERTDALRHASADAVAAIAGDGTLGLFGAP